MRAGAIAPDSGLFLSRSVAAPALARSGATSMLIDGPAVDAALSLIAEDAMVAETANVFFSSLQSKLIGFVLGNLFAAMLFAFLSQSLTSVITAKVNEAAGVPPKPQSLGERLGSLGPGALITLLISLAIDLAGDSSFVLPGIGEFEDVAWAPISAILLKVIFGSNAIAGLDFVKEALPFTDVVPVATLAWASKNLFPESSLSKVLGLAPGDRQPTAR
jgi:hypothetical protein